MIFASARSQMDQRHRRKHSTLNSGKALTAKGKAAVKKETPRARSTVLDLPHAPAMGRASNSVWSEKMPSPRPGSGTRGPRLAPQRTLHTGTSQGFAFDPALRRTSAVASRHRQKSSSERESPSWQRDHKSRQAGTGTVSASAHALRSLTRARARSCGASVPRHLTIFGQQHPTLS